MDEDPLNICSGFDANNEAFQHASVEQLKLMRRGRENVRLRRREACGTSAAMRTEIGELWATNNELKVTLADYVFHFEYLFKHSKWNGPGVQVLRNESAASKEDLCTVASQSRLLEETHHPTKRQRLTEKDNSPIPISQDLVSKLQNESVRKLPKPMKLEDYDRARRVLVTLNLSDLPNKRFLVISKSETSRIFPKGPGKHGILLTSEGSRSSSSAPGPYHVLAPGAEGISDNTVLRYRYFGGYELYPLSLSQFKCGNEIVKQVINQWILQRSQCRSSSKNVIDCLENGDDKLPAVVMKFMSFDREILAKLETVVDLGDEK